MSPELPGTYLRHVVEPQCLGDVADAHAAGEVGSMVGGLGVRMTLAYASCPRSGTRVREVRGRVFGSAGLVAPVSWLACAVRGRSWDEACAHSPEDVLDGLCEGGLRCVPAAVERGAEFAVQALRRALGVAQEGPPADPTGRGILVCRCLGVGDRPIRAAIRAGARDPEAIGEATGACTGCRSCRPELLVLIDEETGPPLPTPAAGLPPVVRVTWARVGPVVRALGLPLRQAELDVEGLRLAFGPPTRHACISEPGAVAVARQILRDTVAEDLAVLPAV